MAEESKSFRRQIIEADKTMSSLNKGQWIIYGAGRLGRGFLNLIANDLKLNSLLVVAGQNTPQKVVDQFNRMKEAGQGYCVETPDRPERTWLSNYLFRTIVDTREIIEQIANPRTLVLSTSVGMHRLSEILPIIAEGLRKRVLQSEIPLILLVCENGRAPDGLCAPQIFIRFLNRITDDNDLSKSIIIPRVVVDCSVPSLPPPTQKILAGKGQIWVEDLEMVRQTLGRSEYVKIADEPTIAVFQTMKLYGYNCLHCLVSILGHYLGEHCIDVIARNAKLSTIFDILAESLATAVCKRHSIASDNLLKGIINEYCKESLDRLRHPVGNSFDNIYRVLKKIENGWYFRDGRIDGPIIDLNLLNKPFEYFQLTHAISLCLYHFSTKIESLRGSLPWLPPDRLSRFDNNAICCSIDTTVFNNDSILHPSTKVPCITNDSTADSAFMEVVAQDCRILSTYKNTPWNSEQMVVFLNRPIDYTLKVVPRLLKKLKCVVFSLNEALIAAESFLFSVTQEMISKHSIRNISISHKDYARHVGTSEKGFFEEMIIEYQILNKTADQLVKEREDLYVEQLKNCKVEMLVKPGFREILRLLKQNRVKVALCSNASRSRIEKTLTCLGLANYFDIIKSPSDGLPEKPSPAMIQSICKEQEINPENCLVVESSLSGPQCFFNSWVFQPFTR